MAIDFLNAMQAAHVSFLPDGVLDSLIEPTERGNRRLSGVDLQKPRMRSVAKPSCISRPIPTGSRYKSWLTKCGRRCLKSLATPTPGGRPPTIS
jgi:hypothetical protein